MPWMNLDYFYRLEEAEQKRLRATTAPLGENPTTGDAFLVPAADRYGGMHVIGVPGMGKSAFLEGLIHNDAAYGRAVIVLDPHGDLADNCLAALPDHTLERTSVLDMADEAYPFGANLFAQGNLTSGTARAQAVERILHCFQVFWPEVMKQQYVPLYLEYATRVLLDNPGATLLDLRRFLMEPGYRAAALKQVREPVVRDFWDREYEALKPENRLTRTRPLLHRLHLLTASPLLRNIIAQGAAIDFRRAIEQHEILVIKLPATTMPKDAGMVGTILMGQISAAIFSFGDLPLQARPGVSLYVDEFQTFATPDFETLFSQGRKFGARLIVAHQRRDQLTSELQAATLSARTKVIFRVTVDDAKKLAQVFPTTAKRPKPEDIQPYPCDYLLSHTHLLTDPGVLAFVEHYLLPLQGHRTNRGQVLITDAEFRAGEFFGSARGLLAGAGVLADFLGGANVKTPPVRVADPTPHLDILLREVMATDNPRLPIPPEVVRGLANCGSGFFPAVRNIMPEDRVLQAGYTPPPHLLRQDEDGWAWLRAPESPGEWLAHCVFCLRRTMAYLAAHPLGNVKETGTSELAHALVRLPARLAFVRSGDDCGPIRTFDAPKQLTGSDLEGRRAFLAWQSHERYCRPREDVEAAFLPAAADGQNAHALGELEAAESNGGENAPITAEPIDDLPEEPALSRWEL